MKEDKRNSCSFCGKIVFVERRNTVARISEVDFVYQGFIECPC